jgi:hypothetical protein
MDVMINAVINGKIRPLHYSVEVMFEINRLYGSVQEALELLQRQDREGFKCLRQLVVMMANDAELCRRAEGYDKSEMLSEDDITTRIKPSAHLHLIDAVMQTITLGYKQEITGEEETETDLGLLELQKKEAAGN